MRLKKAWELKDYLFDHFSSDKKCIQYFIFIYLFKGFEGINVA